MEEKRRIISFRDLNVYQNTYASCIKIKTELSPKLPDTEKHDLRNQLSRSVKAVPRLIAEGHAKRHQKLGFQKYLDEATAECNETIVGLEMCRDIYRTYFLNYSLDELIDMYDKAGRQLFNPSDAWSKFNKNERRNPRTERAS